jgi:hypothetical protein
VPEAGRMLRCWQEELLRVSVEERKMSEFIDIESLLKTQIKSLERRDASKHCGTCRYESSPEAALPCRGCFNSFLGISFMQPSAWEARKVLP